jgi:hypothetical protein
LASKSVTKRRDAQDAAEEIAIYGYAVQRAQDADEICGTNVLAGFESNWSRESKQKLSRNTF